MESGKTQGGSGRKMDYCSCYSGAESRYLERLRKINGETVGKMESECGCQHAISELQKHDF